MVAMRKLRGAEFRRQPQSLTELSGPWYKFTRQMERIAILIASIIIIDPAVSRERCWTSGG
jgi:hypothetical protein